MEIQNRLAYRLRELARATGLSVPFLRNEARAGRLRVRKIGGAVIVKAQDAEEFLNGGDHEDGGQRDDSKN